MSLHLRDPGLISIRFLFPDSSDPIGQGHGVEWFFEHRQSAEIQQLGSFHTVVVCCEEDDGRAGSTHDVFQRDQDLRAVHSRHVDVEDDEVNCKGFKRGEDLLAPLTERDLEVSHGPEGQLRDLADQRVIVYEENMPECRCHSCLVLTISQESEIFP